MEDPFNINERVVCISDRCPCCDDKLKEATRPIVGDIYTVHRVGMYADAQNEPMLAFIAKESVTAAVWPQCNFKRIPPQIIVKDRNVKQSEPV